MNETIRDKRTNELYALGLRFNGSEFCRDDFNVHHTEMFKNNSDWDRMIYRIKNEMKRRGIKFCPVCDNPIHEDNEEIN